MTEQRAVGIVDVPMPRHTWDDPVTVDSVEQATDHAVLAFTHLAAEHGLTVTGVRYEGATEHRDPRYVLLRFNADLLVGE